MRQGVRQRSLGVAVADDVMVGDQTYMPVKIDKEFEAIQSADVEAKPEIMKRQEELLALRYDLRDDPSEVLMSGGRTSTPQCPSGKRIRVVSSMYLTTLSVFTDS